MPSQELTRNRTNLRNEITDHFWGTGTSLWQLCLASNSWFMETGNLNGPIKPWCPTWECSQNNAFLALHSTMMKVNYGRVWLPYLIVEGLNSRLQGVTHRKASCNMEVKHAPLYTPKVSMVMIVIYLWCHQYIIQYWDHVFHNMHVLDICPSTHPLAKYGSKHIVKHS